nr:nuclease-related domain-containing protein [Kineococcus aurantiacus]
MREKLAAAERRQHAWTAGAEGERLVAQALAALEPHGWRLLHDVRWPGRAKANLDHVAIGPGGVVVVDAKNWSGPVTVRDGVLRQGSHRRDEALDGVARAAADMAALLPPRHRSATRGVLCLAAQRGRPAPTAAGVVVVGREDLARHLRSLPRTLSAAAVDELTAALRDQLDGATSPALPEPAQDAPDRGVRLVLALTVVLVVALLVGGFAAFVSQQLGAAG